LRAYLFDLTDTISSGQRLLAITATKDGVLMLHFAEQRTDLELIQGAQKT
jgi:hypothetical protein